MVIRVVITLLAILAVFSQASADETYLVVAHGLSGDSQRQLAGFPGRSWGKTAEDIFLFGADSELRWLESRQINFTKVLFSDEPSDLYLCYSTGESLKDVEGRAYYRGVDYVLTNSPVPGYGYRRLTLRKLPFGAPPQTPPGLVTYHPAIDSMIDAVSQDTLVDYLSRLSGAAPVDVNGEIDTIRTRFSGTQDNNLAADFLKQTLESYGYQAEFHGFYGGELRHVAAYDENRAWTIGENSEALRTTDGGLTWQSMPVQISYALWGVSNVGPDSVWVSGDGGTIRFSSNGGESFTPQPSGYSVFLFGSSFISSAEGWIAGDLGYILHTTNGGVNWARQTTSTSSRLYDVHFVDNQYGWAVGRDGRIIHTTNGGQNWTIQTSNTTQRLYGVFFPDRSSGWTVGWNGVVRHTTDGGANWQSVSLGDNIEKYHVDFTDSFHGYIVGWGGMIYVTSDGGVNWQAAVTGTSADFYGIDFATYNVGYATGDGVLMKTTDSGATWIEQTSGVEGVWRNVIGTKPGTTNPGEQVVICAHFDCTSEQPQNLAPGADDNGSGTTAVIEAARIFAGSNFDKTIKFCLWNGEEQGLLGSAAYAADAFARGDNISGVFNFDMIAWDGNADNSGEFHCGTTSASIALGEIMEDVIVDYGLGMSGELITFGSTDRSDHASFWDYNYAAMLGIEDFSGDFNPFYHTTNDNMTNVVPGFFTVYTQAAVGSAATLAEPDTTPVGITPGVSLPDRIKLFRNYPNPFNASTTISFSLPRSTNAKLVVFDILGRQVETLYDGPASAGDHSITWSADGFASGLYFYRLEAGGQGLWGKMVLLK